MKRQASVSLACFAPRQRGLSLFEFVVVVVVVSVLAGILLERFRYYQELAEKARMQQTLDTLNAGLRFHAAAMLLAGKAGDIPALVKQNPFDWLDEPQRAGYCGLMPVRPLSGCWYYDPAHNTVAYAPIHRRYLSAAEPLLRFGWPAGIDVQALMAVELRPLSKFVWNV